jgi:ankyrin repeat protein
MGKVMVSKMDPYGYQFDTSIILGMISSGYCLFFIDYGWIWKLIWLYHLLSYFQLDRIIRRYDRLCRLQSGVIESEISQGDGPRSRCEYLTRHLNVTNLFATPVHNTFAPEIIYYACKLGRPKLLLRLLQLGYSPYGQNRHSFKECLQEVIKRDHPECFQYLIHEHIFRRQEPTPKQVEERQVALQKSLFFACKHDMSGRYLESLLEQKADPNHESVLKDAILAKNYRCVCLLVQHGATIDPSCVNIASDVGSIPILDIFLAENIDINASCCSTHAAPIHRACMNDDYKTTEYLIEHKADVNLEFEGNGQPLDLTSDLAIMLLLLRHKADPLQCNYNGLDLLCSVALRNMFDVTKVLIERKVDVNGYDRNGTTPLHASCQRPGNYNMTRFLIEQKADVNLHSDAKFYPLHYAQDRATTALLLEYKADAFAQNEYELNPIEDALFYSDRCYNDCVEEYQKGAREKYETLVNHYAQKLCRLSSLPDDVLQFIVMDYLFESPDVFEQ